MSQIKTPYQFTLVLRGVEDSTLNLEDSLYEAGCDDALINFRNGAVFLDFSREASSFKEAIISAILAVESASVCPQVVGVAPEDWVTEAEIAKRSHKNRQAVSLWMKGERRAKKTFPKPIMKLSARSPLWRWCEVVEWLYEHNIIQNKAEVENARFLEHINAALEERDPKIRQSRHVLSNRLSRGS